MFTRIAAVVFGFIALAHLHRIVFGWDFVVANILVPNWVSGIAVFVAATLAVMLWKESCKYVNGK